MNGLAGKVLRGSVAGILGTAAMTVAIAAGKVTYRREPAAPVEITSRAASKAGIRHELRGDSFTVGWIAAHFAYGAVWGAAFALLRPVLPRSAALSGLLFGEGVWALSYLGLMPALELYPRADHDDPSRLRTMVVAHAVYGAATAELADRAA